MTEIWQPRKDVARSTQMLLLLCDSPQLSLYCQWDRCVASYENKWHAHHWFGVSEPTSRIEITFFASGTQYFLFRTPDRTQMNFIRKHVLRVVRGQSIVRWSSPKALVWAPHIRDIIRGQVLYHHHDLCSLCVITQHCSNSLFYILHTCSSKKLFKKFYLKVKFSLCFQKWLKSKCSVQPGFQTNQSIV